VFDLAYVVLYVVFLVVRYTNPRAATFVACVPGLGVVTSHRAQTVRVEFPWFGLDWFGLVWFGLDWKNILQFYSNRISVSRNFFIHKIGVYIQMVRIWESRRRAKLVVVMMYFPEMAKPLEENQRCKHFKQVRYKESNGR
jgi:hypothetical protein